MRSPHCSIVVVEDDESLSQAMERVLQASGFQTAVYRSGEELMATGAADKAASIVLDVQLPGMTGFEVCAALNAGTARRPPVIFITSYDEPEVRAAAEAHGAAGLLIKPFSGRKLVETLHRALLATRSDLGEQN